MKIGIIGASKESLYAINMAQKRGFHVIALDGNPNAEGLKLASESYVIDIREKEKVQDIIKSHNIEFILPVPIGRYLTTIGFLNDTLGLKGLSEFSAEICTDKWLFQQKMEEAKLSSIRHALVTNKDSSFETIEKSFNFPVVLKPRFGSGSRSVLILNDLSSLNSAIADVDLCEEDFVVEEAAIGIEYGVDFAIIDKKLYLVCIRKKTLTEYPFRQATSYINIPKSDLLYGEVSNYLEEVNKIVGLADCLCHADIVINSNGFHLIEISGRPSGHNLHNYFSIFSSGVDMIKEYLNFQTGKSYDFEPHDNGYLGIFYFDLPVGELLSIPDTEVLKEQFSLISYECHLSPGDIIEEIIDDKILMTRGFFVMSGAAEDQLLDKSEKLKQMFSIKER